MTFGVQVCLEHHFFKSLDMVKDILKVYGG